MKPSQSTHKTFASCSPPHGAEVHPSKDLSSFMCVTPTGVRANAIWEEFYNYLLNSNSADAVCFGQVLNILEPQFTPVENGSIIWIK